MRLNLVLSLINLILTFIVMVFSVQAATFNEGVSPGFSDRRLSPLSQQTPEKRSIYDDPTMAIATQYPSNMTVEAGCYREDCRFFFTFKPHSNTFDNATVYLFLPLAARTTLDAERFVTSSTGLIASNGWRFVKQKDLPLGLIYPWLKKIIPFVTRDALLGQILVGETAGQGIVVILIYPSNKADFFLPEAKIILEHLQFKADQLPLNPAQN